MTEPCTSRARCTRRVRRPARVALGRARWLVFAALSLLGACCPIGVGGGPSTGRVRAQAAPGREPWRPAAEELSLRSLPDHRAVADLSTAECHRVLREARVDFAPASRSTAPGVYAPVVVYSRLGSISIGQSGRSSERSLLDCRLAVALLVWSPSLRDAGVVGIEHFSTYRPGARVRGRGRVSGHAHALAIDAARFRLADGRSLSVEQDWGQSERGGAPCPPRRSEGNDARLLRRVVCDAVDKELFQVVLTPHYDRAHSNHVHIELVPDVDWSYVR